ncbi:MAG: anhydro-N-acetylmuramic acid kinase [Gammaproteobacteria bacterium]|nr:anhydro-N-acetylmuramic acid kinase [Pseudomonadales bacterium]MCP5347065.1 anhydro-N-acetylmuramic acid kinase [Pseudomonadales bacterium]
MAEPAYYIGLISGTSIDGIDCALVSFDAERPTLHSYLSYPFPAPLRQQLFALCQQPDTSLRALGEAHIAVGQQFAAAVNALLEREQIDSRLVQAIGSHGQTVFHKPARPLPFSLQIGDPSTIAFLTGITTVADFRAKDLAAGGEGAPLAPLFHRAVFASPDQARVIVNLGGIANISVIAEGREFLGYDTGPANVLMDYWIDKNLHQSVDLQGQWASSGQVNDSLLELLLDDPYFAAPEPKSTGREAFNGRWLEQRLAALGQDLAPADVQATLLELTATIVATEIENQLAADQVYVCGGGAHNTALMQRLAQLLPDSEVNSTGQLGIPPDWVEAMTFAWLARQRLAGIAQDTPAITGASRPVILGGVYLA